MSFRGNHPTRIDEKGRLKLPADFKHLSDEKYGRETKFYITSKGRAAGRDLPVEGMGGH